MVADILRSDAERWKMLGTVASLELPDCWIGAGFVRNAVWDRLHGLPSSALDSDVDVIWFDPARCGEQIDRDIEQQLLRMQPDVQWSVKNQARMHLRNGDNPYSGAVDAMHYWPETATAIAARRTGLDTCEVAAPLGFDDLLGLVLRPAGRFATEKRAIYRARRNGRMWQDKWPNLQDTG